MGLQQDSTVDGVNYRSAAVMEARVLGLQQGMCCGSNILTTRVLDCLGCSWVTGACNVGEHAWHSISVGCRSQLCIQCAPQLEMLSEGRHTLWLSP